MRPARSKLLCAAACLFLAAACAAQETAPTLTLDDAIRLGLERNRALKVVSYDRGISRAQLLVARGLFDPEIQVNRSTSQNFEQESTVLNTLGFEPYQENIYSAALVGQTPIGTTYNLGGNEQSTRFSLGGTFTEVQSFGGLSITQPLLKNFGFGANLVNVRIAKANRAISDAQYRETAISTVTSVVEAYSSLQFEHDALDVARRTRELAASLLADNEKSLAVGNIAQSDVVAARADLASSEENILIYERAVRDAENTLRELIGEDVFFEDKPLFVLAPIPSAEITVDRKEDLQTALRMRSDYEIGRLTIVQKKASEAANNNGLLPEVDFVGGYGYNGLASTLSASRQMVFDRMNPSYSAGLQVTIPLTFAVGRGNARAARLQRQQSEESLRSLAAEIALQVATAEGQVETARKRVIADQAAYALNKQSVDAEEKRKRAGNGSTLEVEQVEQNLATAELALSSAYDSERQAAANYYEQLGVTLEHYHVQLEAR